MKDILLRSVLLGCLFVTALLVRAQQLTVAPAHVLCDYKVNEKTDRLVSSRLQRSLSAYGISSEVGMSRFSVVPEIVVNNEKTSSGVPAYCEVEFDFVCSLKDIYSGKVFATVTLQAKGRGSNKSAAIAKGISALNLQSPQIESFCESAKSKVIAYYQTNIPSIVAKANAAVAQQNYEQALSLLAEVPEETPGYSAKVLPLIKKSYQSYIDHTGADVLARAEAAFAQSPNAEGAEAAAEILQQMPYGSASMAGAKKLVATMKTRVQSISDREFAFEKEMAKYEHTEKLKEIESARQVAIAYAKNQPKTNTYVYLW